MWPVSSRFAEVITGSCLAVTRVRVCTGAPQFSADPTGVELVLLSGSVSMGSTRDVQATIDITIPGDYLDLVAPYGAQLFAERGVDFGDGTREYVPLGYYRIDEIGQESMPYGPIRVSGSDRAAQVIDSRLLVPYPYDVTMTRRALFEKLINGSPAAPVVGYGVYPGTPIPIIYAGYNPDRTLPAGVVEDSIFEHLADLADEDGCVLRFDRLGRLVVDQRDRQPGEVSVYRIAPGTGGTLISASRRISRKGVYNVAVAWGSDPEQPTGRAVAYNVDEGPLDWRGDFGVIPIYYSSPVLRTEGAAAAAAVTRLARYRGLPTETGAAMVPNPALDPLDPVTLVLADGTSIEHLIDSIDVPLVINGASPASVTTRVLNELPATEGNEGEGGIQNPDPTTPPVDPPTDPDANPAEFLRIGEWNWCNLGVGLVPGDPLDVEGDGHRDFEQPALEAGLVLPGHYELAPDGTGVRLTVPMSAGKTSSKTTFPRTEFRGYNRSGGKEAWNAGSGRHVCFVRGRVVDMPAEDPRVCLLQTHDPDDDTAMVRYEFGKIIMRIGDPTVHTISSAALGTYYEYGIIVDSGTIEFWWQGSKVFSRSGAASGSGWYFKWGNYIQARISQGVDLSDQGVVDVAKVLVWHPGYPTVTGHGFAGLTL